MRIVKALMIGRLILTWLWPVLWLVTLPGAQAGALRPANDAPAALVSAETDQQHSHVPIGIHYRSTSRATRRFDSQSAPNDPSAALWLFRIEVARGQNTSCSIASSHARPELAVGWQFLWRTALSPRAPSLVS